MYPGFTPVSVALLTSLSLLVAADFPRFGTFEFDVVALIREKHETPGSKEIFADRFGYRYLFSSASHLAAFNKEPEKFEVQLGGACGKMGELSGRGSPGRHAVYRAKLFVFASDGCRASFQENPEGHIDRDDPLLSGDQESTRKGAKLLALAAQWSGIDSLKPSGGICTVYESTYQQGGKTLPLTMSTTVWTGGDYLARETYDGKGYGRQIKGGRASEIDPAGKMEDMVPTWARALERERGRYLPYILLARKGVSSSACWVRTENGIAEIMVQSDRVTSTVWMEEDTGKITAFESTGRGRGGILGKVKRNYTEYQKVEGIRLPVSWTATFDGEASSGHARKGLRLEIDRRRDL
jgi:YHS domain-containing protein